MSEPLDMLEVGLQHLSTAIKERDPHSELRVRMADILKDFASVKAEAERMLIYIGKQELKAGRLRDEVEDLRDGAAKRRRWLSEAKRARGYSDNTSFDVVWAETCALADRARVSDENPKGEDPEGLRSEGLPARSDEGGDAPSLSPKEQKGE